MTCPPHRWILEADKHEAAAKCACGAERTFTGGINWADWFDRGVTSMARKRKSDDAVKSVRRGAKAGGKATKEKFAKEQA